MSEEMQIEGKPYISSKRAAELSGYAQDYIGQLARKSLIEARRIGGLWYVSMDSLQGYQKKAEEFKPQPPTARIEHTEPGTLIFFDGKEYLSAGHAAEQTGYTQDYVGQLARSGSILSHQVGNRWYVERESITSHKKEKDALLASVQAQSVGLRKPQAVAEGQYPKYLTNASDSGDHALLNYFNESSDLMPFTGKENEDVKEKEPVANAVILEHTVPIKRIHKSAISVKTASSSIIRPKPLLIEAPRAKNTGSLFLLTAAATIIIVVSIGYASVLRQNSVYATNIRSSGVAAMSASAADAFAWLGDVLEPVLTHELTYQRTNN